MTRARARTRMARVRTRARASARRRMARARTRRVTLATVSGEGWQPKGNGSSAATVGAKGQVTLRLPFDVSGPATKSRIYVSLSILVPTCAESALVEKSPS
jgi:hypothetical protein